MNYKVRSVEQVYPSMSMMKRAWFNGEELFDGKYILEDLSVSPPWMFDQFFPEVFSLVIQNQTHIPSRNY